MLLESERLVAHCTIGIEIQEGEPIPMHLNGGGALKPPDGCAELVILHFARLASPPICARSRDASSVTSSGVGVKPIPRRLRCVANKHSGMTEALKEVSHLGKALALRTAIKSSSNRQIHHRRAHEMVQQRVRRRREAVTRSACDPTSSSALAISHRHPAASF